MYRWWGVALIAVLLAATGCAETAIIRVGLVRGQLGPCPESPNCVNSFADPDDRTHYIEPIAFPAWASGSSQSATEDTSASDGTRVLDALQEVLSTWARTTIETRNDKYIHVRAVSLVMRFVDDMELLLDEEKRVVHVRSASRAGYSDLGVNRKRVERLRSEFQTFGDNK